MLQFNSVPADVRELLTSESLCPEHFALGGGTSLALRFGHRMSVDLDFFTTEEFSPEEILSGLPRALTPTVLGKATGSLTLESSGVKVEFLRHAYPLLEGPECIESIYLLSLADVTAMKLNAIANRGSKKDFYDLFRILDEMRLPDALNLFEQKYQNTDRFVAIRSLGWFEEAEGEPDPIAPTGPSWSEVKARISGAVADLT